MLQFLIILSAILFCTLAYLNYRFYHERKAFRERIRSLEFVIVAMHKEQQLKESQVQISEALRDQLKNVNRTLGNEIFDFNHELLDILAQNKLL